MTAVLVVQTLDVYELIAHHFKIARDDVALERLTTLDAYVERTAKSLLDALWKVSKLTSQNHKR